MAGKQGKKRTTAKGKKATTRTESEWTDCWTRGFDVPLKNLIRLGIQFMSFALPSRAGLLTKLSAVFKCTGQE